MVGYGTSLTQTPVVELKSDLDVTAYTKGNGYERVGHFFSINVTIMLSTYTIFFFQFNFHFLKLGTIYLVCYWN